jgi:type 2 lantibiotic biosynthesis protein LanM
MLDNIALADLACRSSNLSERLLIIKQLANSNVLAKCTKQLDKLDTWILSKLSGKLAAMQLKQQLFQQDISNIPTKDILEKILTDYKLYVINIDKLSESDRLPFIQPHSTWLNVYQSALTTLDLPKANFADSCWYDPNIYYGRFAKVCEPFLRLIQQKLQPICTAINQEKADYSINNQVITNIQLELLNRLEISLARAIEADINVYCYQNKITKSSDSEAYIAYLEQSFKDEQSYHRFYCKFPVLGRWLAQVTQFIVKFGEELIQRLTSDRAEISATFFSGKQISQIKYFKLGQSDPHAEGNSVVIVELELSNTEQGTIVYKPRGIQSEAAMQGFLKTLTQAEVIEFATYKVLCKDGYGYAEFIPSGKNLVTSEKEIEMFYNQLGGYLAIFHILGGGDMHYENILVANSNAFICDCETVLEVLPQGMEKLPDTLLDSVFKTGMLDWPRAKQTDNSSLISLTGYNGGESYQTPFAAPQINHRMSLALAVEHQVGVHVEVAGTNRIYYNGKLVQPHDYQQSIVDGFNKVYSWVQQNATQTIKLIEELFASSSVRFVNRATQVYAKLLDAARHPKCLADPLEVDLIFHSLIEYPRVWDETGKLAALEMAALWQIDVPIFTAPANSYDLSYNYQQQLSDTLAISPLNNARDRIKRLSTDNQIRQNQYIYASLSTGEINNKHFVASAVNYAEQIGRQLCELLQPSSSAPWKTIDFTPTGKRLVDINASLYNGSAGICLFLAYLDTIQPQAQFRSAAERALTHAIEQRDTTMLGAFQGTAGLIYLLTHLAHLWDKPALLDQAVELCAEITPQISQDRYYDILHGVAGVIPVMLGLVQATSGKGLSCAQQCAQYLLQQAIRQDDTLSWSCDSELARANLTGFSHGASGIGWALILLGCHTNQSEYITAGRQAFAYEATQFDPAVRNWYDLRKSVMTREATKPQFANFWCNGAAGIGLSRLASWVALGKTDEDILREAYTALDVSLRNFHRLENDSLCHGKSGNAELLLRFAKLADEPYLQMEANVQAQAQWRNFERSSRWTCGAGGNDIFPDLMLGLAGIGMHFLRLAYPERVPSPLLLDPPSRVA